MPTLRNRVVILPLEGGRVRNIPIVPKFKIVPTDIGGEEEEGLREGSENFQSLTMFKLGELPLSRNCFYICVFPFCLKSC